MKNLNIRFLLRISSVLIRRVFYLFMFNKVGKNLNVYGKINIIAGENIIIGNNVHISPGVMLNGTGKIVINDHVHISSGAQVLSAGLDLEKSYIKRPHVRNKIEINEGAWVCSGAIVNMGVSIGRGAVLGAGSVLTKNIPPFEFWGGVPAKKIKDLKRF